MSRRRILAIGLAIIAAVTVLIPYGIGFVANLPRRDVADSVWALALTGAFVLAAR
jgi:hypothetical protein